MSLPTAHNYVIKNMMDNLMSLEKNFLEPKLLIEDLTKAEKTLNESIEVAHGKEFSKDLLESEKADIKLLIEKITALEKASIEKLNWANKFSDYLQANIKRK